jgi:hypothetical protein
MERIPDWRLMAADGMKAANVIRSGRMTIDKIALFEATKAFWPAMVRVSDNPSATHEIYRANEDAFSQDDNWRQLAIWAFHQALGAYEKRAMAKGVPLYSHEVAFAAFDMRMRANLNGDDCWSDERAEYEGS